MDGGECSTRKRGSPGEASAQSRYRFRPWHGGTAFHGQSRRGGGGDPAREVFSDTRETGDSINHRVQWTLIEDPVFPRALYPGQSPHTARLPRERAFLKRRARESGGGRGISPAHPPHGAIRGGAAATNTAPLSLIRCRNSVRGHGMRSRSSFSPSPSLPGDAPQGCRETAPSRCRAR